MAGTIVADTLQNGAGASTSMDNAVYGSAKAWVNYNAVTSTIRASYNVSSVVLNSTGYNQINFTNAFVDANYVFLGTCSNDGANRSFVQFDGNNNGNAGQQATSYIKFYTGGISNLVTVPFIWVGCFR